MKKKATKQKDINKPKRVDTSNEPNREAMGRISRVLRFRGL